MRGLRPSFFGRLVRKERASRVVTAGASGARHASAPAPGSCLQLSGTGMDSSHALLFGLESIPVHWAEFA